MSDKGHAPQVAGYPHGRVPRALRERQVLDVAEELFAERGYDGASMDELARRTGVSKPVIYDLVGNKESLFRRCFERAGAELAERVAAAAAEHEDDPAAELQATALAFFRFIEEHERAWAMLLALDAGGRTEAAVADIRAGQAAFVTARLLARAEGLDPRRVEAMAFAINGAFEAVAHWRREHPQIEPEELAEWVVSFLLPGIQALVNTTGGS